MFVRSTCTILMVVNLTFSAFAQNVGFERGRYKSILSKVKGEVQKNYYDPTFKGIDLDAKFKVAEGKMNNATSISQMNSIIAQFLLDFNDSHLFYIPPGKANKTHYGFEFRMFGDKCLVYKVDKDSDAAKKGLAIGDEIYLLEGFNLDREALWKMNYFYRALSPRAALKLEIAKPDGSTVQISVAARIEPGKQYNDLTGPEIFNFIREQEKQYDESLASHKFYDKIEGVYIWKMPSFDLEPSQVDDIIRKASKSNAIIFDLRNNGGGRVDMVQRLIANVFDRDIEVADEKRRKETKKLIAKSKGKNAFKGDIIVLVDSGSGSASEVFARVIQLEKRGKVVGEQSAGAVMESLQFGREEGLDTVIFFGISVTVADLLMKDGKSLEKVGVTPDIPSIPSGKDLSAEHDPVLSKAVELLGIKLTPEAAGKIFPTRPDTK